jgi:hypothetical protein
VKPELVASLPNYQKNDPTIFLKVGGGVGLERALMNTTILRNSHESTDSTSPATDMDILVEALRTIQT